MAGASFLNQLGSMKDFNAFMDTFQNNEMATAALPLLLQKVIVGLNFPMACTFLFNAGYPDYVFPDPKVKRLLKDIGMTVSMDHYEALKILIMMARYNKKPVAYVHKMLLLIGTGKLSDDGTKHLKRRNEFVDHIIPMLDILINP